MSSTDNTGSLTPYLQRRRRNRDLQQDMSINFSLVQRAKLVLCGNAETLKGHISKFILDPKERRLESRLECARRERRSVCFRRNFEVCGYLVKHPAVFNTQLTEEEVCKSLCCVSLCYPGVHTLLYIILDDPLTDGDKAEMEEIQKILSSRINKHVVVLISQNSEPKTAGQQKQYHFPRHRENVSMLVGRFEQMTIENKDGNFSTETFLEVQVEKFIDSRFEKIQSQGLREHLNDESFVIERKSAVGVIGTGNTTSGSHLKFIEQMSEDVLERRQVKREEEYKGENASSKMDDSLKWVLQSHSTVQQTGLYSPCPHNLEGVCSKNDANTEKTDRGFGFQAECKGLRENFNDESFVIKRKSAVGVIGTGNTTSGSHLKFIEQMSKDDLEKTQVKREEEYKGENKLPKMDDSLKWALQSHITVQQAGLYSPSPHNLKSVCGKNDANTEEMDRGFGFQAECKGLRENFSDESFMKEKKNAVGMNGTGKHLKFTEQMSKDDLERTQEKREEEYKGENMLSKMDDSLKGENKAFGIIRSAQCLNQEIQNLLLKLHLDNRCSKLRPADVLQLTEHSLQPHESCAEEKLIQTFLQKLLMMNYKARYINKTDVQDHIKQSDSDPYQDDYDIFKEMSFYNEVTSQTNPIHPMDVQMAVFHCADGFLKQLIVTKLSQCQYALPLLVPDPFTRQIDFPLWTFKQINKSWKMRNPNISQTQSVYKVQTPMVSFFRFGFVSSSKSQLMNSLINEKHNTFFHRNCPGSSTSRVLMDGVVEIAWYCPSGTYDDKFTECVAFCNLHGDAVDHEKQLQILTEMASANVVVLPKLHRNEKSTTIIQNLYTNRKPLICLFTEEVSTLTETRTGKYKIGLKGRNQSDVFEELRRAINNCLLSSGSFSTFSLEDVSKQSDIRVDEEDDDDCKKGREGAQQMMSLLRNKNLTEIKESFLPCQGKLWHKWCHKNKELHRPQTDDIEKKISQTQTEMMEIRQQQHDYDISEFLKLFIKEMKSNAAKNTYFLKWLGILLDEYTSKEILHEYNEKRSAVVKLKENHDQSEQLEAKQTELERISEELQAATFGLEHIMREIGQIYESCSSVKKNKKDLQFQFTSLPSLAAEMMISGFPLELMDGDVAHVPLIWISAVLDKLIKKLGDQRVFVLSVLGIQSTGKSTMLNAMFGLQFAVSAGRCTRGAFMQLVRVSDEMKAQMSFDFILVVDTEGLCALELAGRSTRHHDNELATFVVGLANMTLINIFGENPAEMQDILQIVVQAFLRMKKVRLNPSCMFVHQNVSDITAEEKNMEGRRRLQKTLDEMTKLAAKEEVCDVECFSEVIEFDVNKDVKYFAQLWEGSPPMAPPNPKYCENVQELKECIISHASNSPEMKLRCLGERIKDLWEALLKERFVFSFRNSLEISAYRRLETEYSKWSWRLRSAMIVTENKLHNKIGNEAIHEVEENDLQIELKKTSEKVNKSMSEFFEKDTDAALLIHWKMSFEIKIKEIQENIVRETKRKLNEILQLQGLKKKIDDQRTHHENMLYEKSKELALNLKGKAKDNSAEFDSFWKLCVKKITTDSPAIKDIDIFTDVRKLLSDLYESIPVDPWQKDDAYNIFNVQSYYEYVNFKKLTKRWIGEAYRTDKETSGQVQTLSQEDQVQIRSLVTDVVQQTDKMIRSFNILKTGYNISYIQQLIDSIKRRVQQHMKESLKYVLKNEFFRDLVFYICKTVNKMITDQHKMFREANDPVLYLEKKRDEYYSVFQKYCHGAASAAIFGEIICQKLKEPIEQSVCKKCARDLTDEIRTNCESLNGNRSKLEKHILKTLAEKEDFFKYIGYIHYPRLHFNRFIRDEVSQYITDKFRITDYFKIKENYKYVQKKIMVAAHKSTERIQVTGGDIGLWLKHFTQQLSDVLIFSEKDLSGVKHDDVDDFELLEDVIRKELTAMKSDISSSLNTKSFLAKLDHKDRPDEILIDHFSQCCWVRCPFCGATCTNTIENHDGDHSVPFHRSIGLSGIHYSSTSNLSAHICTSAVAHSNLYFYPVESEDKVSWTEYRRAGGEYEKWCITPDLSELPYWKWFVCRFQKDLEKYYNKTFGRQGEIPDEWRKYTKQEAFESLDKYF